MMNALPLFPQSPTANTSALLGSGPASLHGEGGDALHFGALLSQSIAPTPGGAAPPAALLAANAPSTGAASSAAAAPTGSFDDLSVIFQLLRGASAEGETAETQAQTATAEPSAAPIGSDFLARLAAQTKGGEQAIATPPSDPSDHTPLMAQMIAQFLGKPAAKPSTDTPQADLPDTENAPTTESKNLLQDVVLSGQNNGKDMPLELQAQAGVPSDMAAPTAGLPQPVKDLAAMTAAAPFISKDSVAESVSTVPTNAAAVPTPWTDSGRKPATPAPTAPSPQQPSEAAEAIIAPTSLPRFQPISAPAATASPIAPPAPTAVDGSAAMQVMFTQAAAAPLQSAPVESAQAAAPVAETLLDMTNDDAWIDQIAKDIAATKSATGDISFRLMPRHLGRLDVIMSQGDDGVTVRMDAQHESAAAIIVASQTRLVDELRQQGVRVASAEVSHNAGDAGRQSQGRDGQNQRPDGTHFIETAPDRLPDAERSDKGSADRRGRFA